MLKIAVEDRKKKIMLDPSKSKMYILVKDTTPAGLAINAAAHASLSTYLYYSKSEIMKAWLDNSFKKVVCKVNEVEFEQAKTFGVLFRVITESSLNNAEIALCFMPMTEFPKFFKHLKLYK